MCVMEFVCTEQSRSSLGDQAWMAALLSKICSDYCVNYLQTAVHSGSEHKLHVGFYEAIFVMSTTYVFENTFVRKWSHAKQPTGANVYDTSFSVISFTGHFNLLKMI